MATRLRASWTLVLALAVAWAAPLIGLALAGRPMLAYLSFPPRTQHVAHAPFAWEAFAILCLPAIAACGLILAAMRAGGSQAARAAPAAPFPRWGWLGVLLLAAGWVAAWNEAVLPAAWRRHTFTPLWLGYVLIMNALVYRRTGRSLLTHRMAWFFALFPASVVFWWLFEHLNQFARNWYYRGVEPASDWEYFLQASLPFSTVLPAVASTWMWLRQRARLESMRLPPVHGDRALAWSALVAGSLGLGAIGLWPEALFAWLWLGPLLLLAGLQRILSGESLLAPLAHGDWRPLLQPALAALACGLLWELWNYGSLAKWQYSVPYVQRFHVFEMPLLGYAGYLPFGVVCALVLDLLGRAVDGHSLYGAPPCPA